jgi:hypothetical protein
VNKKIFKLFLSLLFFFFIFPPLQIWLFNPKTKGICERIFPFSCPTPPTFPRNFAAEKKEKKASASPTDSLFFGGEILHMPASGLGEKSTM